MTGKPPAYRGRRRRPRAGSGRPLAAVGAVVAAVVIGTFAVVQWASPDSGPVTLGTPPTPEGDHVVTTPNDLRQEQPPTAGGEGATTAAAGPSRTPGAGSTTPGADSAAPNAGSTTPEPAGAGSDRDGSYEAEHAVGRRGASPEPLAAASGGQVVKLNPNATLRFSGIGAEHGGPHLLTVYYAGTAHATAEVSVNGGVRATVEFPDVEDGAVGTITFWVQLSEGDNSVTVYGTGPPGPLLDRILIGE